MAMTDYIRYIMTLLLIICCLSYKDHQKDSMQIVNGQAEASAIECLIIEALFSVLGHNRYGLPSASQPVLPLN